jgi:hypothetical protein
MQWTREESEFLEILNKEELIDVINIQFKMLIDGYKGKIYLI